MFWTDQSPDQSLGAALHGAAIRFGDKEAFTFPERRLSLEEIDTWSDDIAKGALALRLAKGDRVAIWMASHAEWPAIFFGLLKIGVILVPINTRLSLDELEFTLRDSGVKALIFKNETTKSGKEYAAILRATLGEPTDANEPLRARVPALETIVDLAQDPQPGTVGIAALVAGGEAISDADLEKAKQAVAPSDEALIQYTSGTTSRPKGARLSHVGMLRGVAHYFHSIELQPDDAYFSVQPFYHCGGSMGTMLAPILTGCRMITLTYFDSGEALDAMAREKATVTVGHQPHFIEYMNHPGFDRTKLNLERMLVIGPPDLLWAVRDKFGVDQIVSMLGMTETHMMGTTTSLADDPIEVRFNTNGRPHPGVRLEIRDTDTGAPVPADEPGEIFLHVAYPMLGYLNDPQKTAEVFDDQGWYRTGDRGILGKDGNVRLLGRVREMIRVGGESVGAAEVEACLMEYPAVKQAAAVPRQDERLGEVVIAFVELRPGETANSADIVAHCQRRLASFKVPRAIHFITEWPTNAAGKVQKRELSARIEPV